MGDYCGFSSNLAWRWSLNVLLSCMGGVSLWERCVLPPCADPVLLGGSGAHTQLRLRHRRVLYPPSSQEPVLPTASFVGLFFSSYQLFFLCFFPPFLLTHMHKVLFVSHPAPSVLSASRSLFLSYINSNPLPWKLG